MTRYQCPDCGYVYDEVTGHPHEGFPAGTKWEQIPEDWSCPDCAVRDKVDFVVLQEGLTEAPRKPASSATNKANTETIPEPAPAKSSEETTHKDTYQKWICITCGHIYDEALGDEAEGFPPGTRFEDIPDDWCCPECGATKEDYVLHEQ